MGIGQDGASRAAAARPARSAVDAALGAVWRIESASIVAGVARLVRDIGLAEELAGDALVSALEHWSASGIPDNPGAWLMRTAKNAALDHLRREKSYREKCAQVGHDLLRLIFTACHPVLPTEARVALTLKLLGGLGTHEIARAFLAPEPTIAQRIVRAKRTLGRARVPFELPPPAELAERLGSVLEVVYLIFNEGYTATSGGDWMRPALQEEALRLGRMLAELAPREPEALGLLALMELQASRAAARVDRAGRPVLLLEQDRLRWDGILIRRGLAALARAELLGPAGPYALQAAIAACHARARTAAQTDWKRIAALYGELARVGPSPVVELNRAVAVGMAEGPAAGLALVDALAGGGALARYQWLPAVRGELLEKLGRRGEAAAEFTRAARMAANAREKALLEERAGANAAKDETRP
jgi:predicted RNA polymerase sigma factor